MVIAQRCVFGQHIWRIFKQVATTSKSTIVMNLKEEKNNTYKREMHSLKHISCRFMSCQNQKHAERGRRTTFKASISHSPYVFPSLLFTTNASGSSNGIQDYYLCFHFSHPLVSN